MPHRSSVAALLSLTLGLPLFSQVEIRSDRVQISAEGHVYVLEKGKGLSPLACQAMPLGQSMDKQVHLSNGVVWVGDGRKILSKTCQRGEVKQAKLPERLQNFAAFEVTEDDRIVLWAPTFLNAKGEPSSLGGSRSDWGLGLIVDPKTGKVDLEFSKIRIPPGLDFYEATLMSEVITTVAGSKVVIAGKYSGRICVLDTTTGTTKDIEVIKDSDLPPKGSERVNHGASMTQLIPLPDGDLVISARHWLPASPNLPGRWLDVFRTLYLSDLSLSSPDLFFQGVEAGSGAIWVDWERRPHLVENIEADIEVKRPTPKS